MEGSVQYANGRVLVTAQLIDPTTNAHLWSENYDREFADIFAIQADIATKIAEAMQAQLTPDERQSIQLQMTNSPEAYALYLRAMELADWDFSPGDSTAEFHGLLDDAIELDPAFARAHAAKANVYSFQRRSQALAKESAETALSLDPNLGSAYSALAKVHARAMNNAEALDAFDTALQLSPNDIDILDDFSRYLMQHRYTERSLQLAGRVLELDPGRAWFMALMLWRAGDIEAAVETQRKVVAARPDNHSRRLFGAVLEYLSGNEGAATREARIASRLRIDDDLDFNVLATYAQSYGTLGFADEAAKYLVLFIARASQAPEGAIDPSTWARVYMGAGVWDKALEYVSLNVERVENGYRSGDTNAIATNRYHRPELERPEFVELRKRLGYKVPGL
jgi:adenylate cyclase